MATLGNFATKLLSGRPVGITRVHGQEQEVDARRQRAVPLYPLYHPAAALYTPSMLTVLEEDFARHPGAARRAPAPVPEPEPRGGADRARARSRPTPSSSASSSVPQPASARARARRPLRRTRPRPSPAGSRRARAGRRRHRRAASSAPGRRRSCAAPAARSASTEPVTSPTFTIGHRYRRPGRRLAPRPLPLRRRLGRGVGRPRAVLRRRGRLRRVAGGRRGRAAAARALASRSRTSIPSVAGVRARRGRRGAARRDRAMLILAFDTATDVATSALVDDGEVLGERRLDGGDAARGRRRAAAAGAARTPATSTRSRSAPARAASPRMRIGLAAARGLALALDVPAAGVSTLDALAAGRPARCP